MLHQRQEKNVALEECPKFAPQTIASMAKAGVKAKSNLGLTLPYSETKIKSLLEP